MSNKIRIAIVISHPIQHFCPQYASFAKNKKIDFKVFFGSALGWKSYKDENFRQEINWPNLKLDKFDHEFLNGDAVIQPDKHLDAPALENALSRYKPDLVFNYGYFQKLQRRTYRWALRNRVPLAYISDSELRHQRNALKEFFKSIYLRRHFSRIDYFLTMGNANEAYYRHFGVSKQKMIRMHYPIDFDYYRQSYLNKAQLRDDIRKEYGISKEATVLSVVGKLVPWKNQNHIIAAMKVLEQQGTYVHLFILGSGEMKSAWEKEAGSLRKSMVHFAGFVNPDRLAAYYAATDIYVHPASLEPHSVAISEAIMMGCPVILSDRCGSYGETDDVQPGKNGFVFRFGNTQELADKLLSLIADADKREAFGRYSHQLGMEFQLNSHSGFLTKLASSSQ